MDQLEEKATSQNHPCQSGPRDDLTDAFLLGIDYFQLLDASDHLHHLVDGHFIIELIDEPIDVVLSLSHFYFL